MTIDTLTRGRWAGVVFRCANGNARARARALRQTEANARMQMRGRTGPPLRFGEWYQRVARSPQLSVFPVLAELELVTEREAVKSRPLPELCARYRVLSAWADLQEAEANRDAAAADDAEARHHELTVERRAIRRVMRDVHRHDPVEVRT